VPITRILTPPAAEAEPVTLALLKAQARVDGDAEDELLRLYASAARERVEAYTGRYFAAQTLELTFELGEAYILPAGATATSVTGFFTSLDALAARASYLSEYRKAGAVSRDLPWAEALQQTYTLTATITGDTQYRSLCLGVMLKLAAESYRNREVADLSVQWRLDLAPACTLPIGY
jgi:hypothetical protein